MVGFERSVSFHDRPDVRVLVLLADNDDAEYVLVSCSLQSYGGEHRVAHEPGVAGACGDTSG